MKKTKVSQRDLTLLNEAARRMVKFKHDINNDFLGLGYPSEYKSEYFTASFGETKKVLNWYKLTQKGKDYFDKNKTKVVFLIEKDSEDEVFAYFVDEINDLQGHRVSYAHIGQHSACHPEYAKECKEATPEQYADLKKELESIGYNLQAVNRQTVTQ